jgi:DNA-binding MarR family transcriptional regulator
VFPFVPLEGISVSALAGLARVRKQTMAEAVDQLERMGYVERRLNPADRRSRLVFLTPRGASVKPVTHAAAARVENHWAKLTSREDLESMRALLLGLLTELRAE